MVITLLFRGTIQQRHRPATIASGIKCPNNLD